MKRLKKALINLVVVLFAIGGLGMALHYSEPTGGKDLPRAVQEVIGGVVHVSCPEWQGSGFVVSPNVIVTARHVTDGVEDFTITMNDGHQLKATRAISSKNYDVGFIYIDDLTCVKEDCEYEYPCGFSILRGKHEVKLRVPELGSIDDCVLGQNVFTIGSPYGKKHFNAVTSGILSMFSMNVEGFGITPDYGWSALFMSDNATWAGNSGSPIFTLDGVVRGVLVGGHRAEENTSYCVPLDLFIGDLEEIELMFLYDKYQKEEEPKDLYEEVYNTFERWVMEYFNAERTA